MFPNEFSGEITKKCFGWIYLKFILKAITCVWCVSNMCQGCANSTTRACGVWERAHFHFKRKAFFRLSNFKSLKFDPYDRFVSKRHKKLKSVFLDIKKLEWCLKVHRVQRHVSSCACCKVCSLIRKMFVDRRFVHDFSAFLWNMTSSRLFLSLFVLFW